MSQFDLAGEAAAAFGLQRRQEFRFTKRLQLRQQGGAVDHKRHHARADAVESRVRRTVAQGLPPRPLHPGTLQAAGEAPPVEVAADDISQQFHGRSGGAARPRRQSRADRPHPRAAQRADDHDIGLETQDGHLLIGRNFDFNALPDFDHTRVGARVEPDEGIAFISVTWPGLIGVVSGINDERISISVNAAQCGDMRRIGTPVSLVMRHVLQHAASLDEAIDIIRASQVFVADCYLVADGETGEAAVVEKTPLRCAVRRPAAGEATLVCSNHFLTPELKADAANVRYLAEGTTVARHERMEALLAARKEPLSPAAAAAILRDRAVPGVPMPVLGHLAAINSITATHSVVIDATAGIIWVAVTPHQLGPYVPFGLKTFENPPGAAVIPADPILADGSYGRCIQARQLVKDARKLGRAGRHDEAAAELSKAIALNPDHYLAHLILGRMRLGQKRFAEAAAHLERAQALHPAFGSQRRAVVQMLDTCGKKGAD